MLKFTQILGIDDNEFKNYKVHLATDPGDKMRPYKKLMLGQQEFTDWQESQTNKNFGRRYIISLAYIEKDKWMFAGVYEVMPVPPRPIERNGWNGWKYETRLVDVQQDLIGRAVIYFHRNFRHSYLNLEMIPADGGMPPRDMYLYCLHEGKVSIREFPGFDQVDIDYELLKAIVGKSVNSWKTALSNVKGVYLIVDARTGRQYVGSAYGEECIWQRWEAYAASGHGGNVELKRLLAQHGADYAENFRYSILEVCNMNLGNDYIIGRESHWKNILMTREFGLNEN